MNKDFHEFEFFLQTIFSKNEKKFWKHSKVLKTN